MSEDGTNEAAPAAEKKTKAKKAKAAKGAKTKARRATGKKASAASRERLGLKDEMKIKIVGKNTFREGGRYHTALEQLKKYSTVGAFRQKFKPVKSEKAGDVLRVAVSTGYAKIA